ncbi:hypothetical protein GQ43DRAFT_86446 [Delitschia confertaspora ATCC 74209]|uniref:Uncharacterized protein n=1 Tax=Delitschia confertaspora ATCC 74209 TaxID=1513339 RepID=A0A9P4JJD5_9PLEO|nr:hypothetical protein GQ43DRAFT_86446 [Delitschia confertaspora ATCC 74209]
MAFIIRLLSSSLLFFVIVTVAHFVSLCVLSVVLACCAGTAYSNYQQVTVRPVGYFGFRRGNGGVSREMVAFSTLQKGNTFKALKR